MRKIVKNFLAEFPSSTDSFGRGDIQKEKADNVKMIKIPLTAGELPVHNNNTGQ
jgi:hypothetical protein